MLVPDNTVAGGIRAKILDFGIAKLLPGRSEDSIEDERRSVKTRTGALIGTPAYMSPEQCRAAGPPDEKTDVYSLGTIFFEILFGEPPFISESAGELYALHMFAPPPDLRPRIKSLDPRLAVLVNRMLVKKADERPSMEAVLEELQAIASTGLSDGPIASRPCNHQDKVGRRDSSDALAAIGSNSSFIRHQLNANLNTTTNGSTGERVSPVVGRKAGGKLMALLGGAGVVAVGGVVLFIALHLQTARVPASPTKPDVIAVTPAVAPPAPNPPPAKPEATAAATASTPATPPAAPDGAATPRARKGKSSRKGASGSKSAKYQIELWK